MTETEQYLKSVMELHGKTTPGKWKIGHRDNSVVAGENTISPIRSHVADCPFTHSSAPNKTLPSPEVCKENAVFIAKSHSDIPKLVRMVEEAQETLRRIWAGGTPVERSYGSFAQNCLDRMDAIAKEGK